MLGPDRPDSLKQLGTFEEAIKLTQDLLPVYDELEKLMDLPGKEFDAKYPEFKKKAEAANPMAGVLLPALGKVGQAAPQSGSPGNAHGGHRRGAGWTCQAEGDQRPLRRRPLRIPRAREWL